MVLSHTMRAVTRAASTTTLHPRLALARAYHQTAPMRYSYKDDQDRTSVKPRANEYAKSGSDNDAAASPDAFDGNQTDPATSKNSDNEAGAPLEVSPANPEVSKSKGASKEIDGGGDTSGKKKSSGSGSPQKKGKPAE